MKICQDIFIQFNNISELQLNLCQPKMTKYLFIAFEPSVISWKSFQYMKSKESKYKFNRLRMKRHSFETKSQLNIYFITSKQTSQHLTSGENSH